MRRANDAPEGTLATTGTGRTRPFAGEAASGAGGRRVARGKGEDE